MPAREEKVILATILTYVQNGLIWFYFAPSLDI
jgi:hypothetical protein